MKGREGEDERGEERGKCKIMKTPHRGERERERKRERERERKRGRERGKGDER